MSLTLIKIRTILRLGLKNVFIVIWYRIRLKSGTHPGCKITAKVPSGPFFDRSLEAPLGLLSVSNWVSSANLFGHINIPLSNFPPKWTTNPLTRECFSLPLKPWWKISDFEEKTGDIKLIWEQSRMNWVVPFAQRARNGDQASLVKLNQWLEDWIIKNPP